VNNKLVINFTPGSTMLHKMTGGTKVLLFVLFTVAVIATFDIRVLLPLMAVPVAAIISMKPNYKPLAFLFGFTFVTVGVIGSIMLIAVSRCRPDPRRLPYGDLAAERQALYHKRNALVPSHNLYQAHGVLLGRDRLRADDHALGIRLRAELSAHAL
jgi:energy-coupling factor transporter transmembrane protein EcfT